jgi:hypothetical protein
LGFGRRPAKGMFKGLDKSTPATVLAGVCNAAWDMSLLRNWAAHTRAHNSRKCYVLCSADNAILMCADDYIVLSGAGPTAHDLLQARFERDWGGDAERLLRLYDQLSGTPRSDTEAALYGREARRARASNWVALARDLEDKIRALVSRGA